jgi:hypothetical protein
MENKEDIFSRHSSEKGLNLAGVIIELEARIRTTYIVIDELKEVIAGQAKWAEIVDTRLKKLEPTIQIFSESEAKTLLK